MLWLAPLAPEFAGAWRFGAPEVFAQLWATLPLFYLVLGLWAAASRFAGSGWPGLLAGGLLFCIAPLQQTLGYAYVDNGLALFCWAAILLLALEAGRSDAWRSDAWRSGATPLLAGLLMGAACSIKLFGLVLALILGLLILHGAARAAGPGLRRQAMLRGGAVYAAAWLAVSGVWYWHSYRLSGDPFHPSGPCAGSGFFSGTRVILPCSSMNSPCMAAAPTRCGYPRSCSRRGCGSGCRCSWGICSAAPRRRCASCGLAFLLYFLFWFLVVQVSRYLAPLYALGCWLTVQVVLTFARQRAGRAVPARLRAAGVRWGAPAGAGLAVAAALTVLFWGGGLVRAGLHSFEQAQARLEQTRGYALLQSANRWRDRQGQTLVQIGFEGDVYFFRGRAKGDWFGPNRYRDLLDCPPLPAVLSRRQLGLPCGPLPAPAVWRQRLRAAGAGLLLLSHQVLAPDSAAVFRADGWQVLDESDRGLLLAPPAAD
ncbi:hypothetical protein [Castellaniella defragrans]|uniref:hypothetical protein n=1 Tax=Castellaniella defragrans TaxID=75697 RepID=UPI002AFE2DA5|nr:hypothetical protein [Castellaniella defragrans]